MDDGSTTVNLSLKRFKELESYEQVFNALSSNEKFTWYKAWGDGYVVDKSNEAPAKLVAELKSAVEMRDDIIRKVREYESKTGKKVFP